MINLDKLILETLYLRWDSLCFEYYGHLEVPNFRTDLTYTLYILIDLKIVEVLKATYLGWDIDWNESWHKFTPEDGLRDNNLRDLQYRKTWIAIPEYIND